MVRLKVEHDNYVKDEPVGFQFQNGAIKSLRHQLKEVDGRAFNSKMVRLKVTEADYNIVCSTLSIPKWCD